MYSLATTNSPCSFRPMKIVEQADRVLDEAEVLLAKYEDIMEPRDRTVAEDTVAFAGDFRQGVEEKSLLAKRTQAKQYLNHAQGALETVKKSVDEAIEL